MSPARILKRVLFPPPDRPKRATISPSRTSRLTPARTRCTPSPVRKNLPTFRASSRTTPHLLKPKPLLRQAVEPAPEEAVQKEHEAAHDHDAQKKPSLVSRLRGLGDVSPKARGSRVFPCQETTSATMEAFQVPPLAVMSP